MEQSALFGLAWAGIMMFFQFMTWPGNLLEDYYDWLKTLPDLISKPIGFCIPCTAFWVGIIFQWLCQVKYYEVFIGVSEGMLVLYVVLLAVLFPAPPQKQKEDDSQ